MCSGLQLLQFLVVLQHLLSEAAACTRRKRAFAFVLMSDRIRLRALFVRWAFYVLCHVDFDVFFGAIVYVHVCLLSQLGFVPSRRAARPKHLLLFSSVCFSLSAKSHRSNFEVGGESGAEPVPTHRRCIRRDKTASGRDRVSPFRGSVVGPRLHHHIMGRPSS